MNERMNKSPISGHLAATITLQNRTESVRVPAVRRKPTRGRRKNGALASDRCDRLQRRAAVCDVTMTSLVAGPSYWYRLDARMSFHG